MPDSNPQHIEETDIYDILETLIRGWKQIAVFLAAGLVAAWLWLPGAPAPRLVKSTLEAVWSPGYLLPYFSVQIPTGRPLSAVFGRPGEAEEAVRLGFSWSLAALSTPPDLKTVYGSFQAGQLGPGREALTLNGPKLESAEPGKLVWACQSADLAAGLEILNDWADRFEQYLMAELNNRTKKFRTEYEEALAAVEKRLAGQEAALTILRADSLNEGATGQGEKQPSAGGAEGRPGLSDWRNRENDLLADIALQEAQKIRWRVFLNQLAATEAWPVLRRSHSAVVIEPESESRRTTLVKAAGLVFLALVLGCWSVFAADGWRRHRAKRRAAAGLDGPKG